MFGFVTVLKFRGGVGWSWGCRGEASLGGNREEAKGGHSQSARQIYKKLSFPMCLLSAWDYLESIYSINLWPINTTGYFIFLWYGAEFFDTKQHFFWRVI